MSDKILFFLLFFVCSCRFYSEIPHIIFDDFPEEILEKSLSGKKSQEKTQCRQKGKACSEYESCKTFCDDLFFLQKGKENCYKWSHSYFKNFEKLANQLETLSFSNLDIPTVKCFFEMVEDHRITLFKDWTKKSAEIFLTQIAINYELAGHLYQADKKHFYILKDLLEEFDGRNQRAIRKEIFSQSHFITLALAHKNQPAWNWIDSFIHHDCDKTATCQFALEYYCEVLEETSRKDLESLFANHWFERAYKKDIESETCNSSYCEYGKVTDFKTICEKI